MIDELLLTLKSLRPINLVLFISVPCINYVTKKIYNFFFFYTLKSPFPRMTFRYAIGLGYRSSHLYFITKLY